MDDETKADDAAGVGYGRPPMASQFKKGQSGNPRGRPRKVPGRRAVAGRVLGELQRLTGQQKGSRVRFSALELLILTVKQMAAAGHAKATALYTGLTERYGHQETADRPVGYLVVPERLTEEEWEALYSPKETPATEPEV